MSEVDYQGQGRARLPSVSGAGEPISSIQMEPVIELREVVAALTSQLSVLERELRTHPERPSVKAVNKLQAVLSELEIAGVIVRRLVRDVQQFLSVPGSEPLENRLSGREREVLTMLTNGQTISEVAANLALNVRTVSTYRVRILRKLELATTAQLVRYGITHHIDSSSM